MHLQLSSLLLKSLSALALLYITINLFLAALNYRRVPSHHTSVCSALLLFPVKYRAAQLTQVRQEEGALSESHCLMEYLHISSPLCPQWTLHPLWVQEAEQAARQGEEPDRAARSHKYLVPAQELLLWNQAVLTLQFL